MESCINLGMSGSGEEAALGKVIINSSHSCEIGSSMQHTVIVQRTLWKSCEVLNLQEKHVLP